MSASDAIFVPKKHKPYRVTFPLFDENGDLKSAAGSLDSEISKDGGSFSDCTNEATEIGTTGIYRLDLTAEEMDADTVAVIVKSAGAKTMPIVFYPQEVTDVLNGLVKLKVPAGLVERSGVTSGKITRTGYPDYGIIFTGGGTPTVDDFDPNMLIGAVIQDIGAEGVEPVAGFWIILGGYFFDDADLDKTKRVFGIALENRFAIKEGQTTIADAFWTGSDLAEAGDGSGWTFIVAKVSDSDSDYPASAHSLSIYINPSATRQMALPTNEDAVYYDKGNTRTGTVYPAGTRGYPTGNIDDAINMSIDRETRKVLCAFASSPGAAAIGVNINFMHFVGINGTGKNFNCGLNFNGKILDRNIFERLYLTGTHNGDDVVLINDVIEDATFSDKALFFDCLFLGTIQTNDDASINKCQFNDGSAAAIFDAGSGTANHNLHDCTGKIQIRDVTGGTVNLHGFKGDIEILSTCTGGTINIIGGSGKLVDNHGGTCVVNVEGFGQCADGIVEANIKEVNDAAVSSVNDFKADVSALATEANATTNKNTVVAAIAALNDLSQAEVAAAVWSAAASSYISAGTFGEIIMLLYSGVVSKWHLYNDAGDANKLKIDFHNYAGAVVKTVEVKKPDGTTLTDTLDAAAMAERTLPA